MLNRPDSDPRASSLPEMINIWEIRSKCLQNCSNCSAPGGWVTQLLIAMHPGTQTPPCSPPRVWTANTDWVLRSSYSREGQGKERSPQSQWEHSCRCLQQGQHSAQEGSTAPRAGFWFCSQGEQLRNSMAKAIRRTTEQWPSEQVISERQRMKGQRNSKAALWNYW